MVAYDSMVVIVWYLGEDCEEDGEETGTMLTGCMQNESVRKFTKAYRDSKNN